MSYILAPSIPPLRGEEKDKLLILEGVGGGVFVPHNTEKCCKVYPCGFLVKYLEIL
jgi:hypothetical protein